MEYTKRGFRIYRRTKDVDGREVSIHLSSLASEDAVWIFQGDGVQEAAEAIQVNRAGAIDIIDGLTAFLAHTDNKGD